MREQGFTLVELIITVAIAAILAALAAPSFNEQLANYRLKQTVDEVKEDILLVKSESVLNREDGLDFTLSGNSDRNVVITAVDSAPLQIYFNKDGQIGDPTGGGTAFTPLGRQLYQFSHPGTDRVYTIVLATSGKTEVYRRAIS